MKLTDEEKRMLSGEYGPGTQKAMALLVEYGEAFDAERMVEITSAHLSLDQVPLPYFAEMTEGARARVPTSVHAMYDPAHLSELGLAKGPKLEQLAARENSILEIIRKAGFLETITCSPYLIGNPVRKGDILSWMGSSGQVMANSLGARANREGAAAVLASALTGRIPYQGMYRPEKRYAKVQVELKDLDPNVLTDGDYGALGYYVGSIAKDRNIVFSNLSVRLSLENCKFLFSPLPVSGAVVMCHIVGVTAEADTLEEALGHKQPEEKITVTGRELRETVERLTTAKEKKVDLVAAGCPHCTILEIKQIASLLNGKKLAKDVHLTIGAAKPVYTLAKQLAYADIIEKAGGIFVDCCVGPGNPVIHFTGGVNVTATNSARAAHYMARISTSKIFYGSTEQCIDAAVSGKWSG